MFTRNVAYLPSCVGILGSLYRETEDTLCQVVRASDASDIDRSSSDAAERIGEVCRRVVVLNAIAVADVELAVSLVDEGDFLDLRLLYFHAHSQIHLSRRPHDDGGG